MKNCLKIAFMALLVSGILILGGCPDEAGENKVASGLVGNWSNELSGNELKVFTIKSNGSFRATLNPYPSQGGDMGTVTGVLIREGKEYKMNNMKETTGKDWGNAVKLYNGAYVKIVLSENNAVFTLNSDNAVVEQFFGGTYLKQE